MNQLNVYFRFLQFSLGEYEGREFLSGEALRDFDWQSFFRFAKEQTLLGIAFDGVQRLGKECAPPQSLLLSWFAIHQQLRMQNLRLDKATAYIYNKVRAEGFRCCILKGQGNAVMYPHPASRVPGDVDVWVDASREDIRRLAALLVRDGGCVGEESLNHIGLTMHGIAVELHSTPAILCNPLYNHRLQKWLRENVERQCCNMVSLPDNAGDVAVPTADFNVVYQLYHLYHHYLYEGIGLRQFVDYYFVSEGLRVKSEDSNGEACLGHSKDSSLFVFRSSLKKLGLWNFCGAVMYVLHEVMGKPEERMIAPMDEERGKLLLAEILEGGNFGHHGENRGGALTWRHNLYRLEKDCKLMRYYPSECMAEPFYRLYHFLWRKGRII